MLRNQIYYRLKPWLPKALRMAIRRQLAGRLRRLAGNSWPISKGSEVPPEGWRGWPDGKKFAFVLTHDVEGVVGLQRCRDLLHLEVGLGFYASFNFIPKGDYNVPDALRAEIVRNGFEVGVHDLRHDGHLYRSAVDFRASAEEINHYLEHWGAVGFRSGFMLHQLDWIHSLAIEYDASTFDTDPFEPQPEGRHTIFPFWVSGDTARRNGSDEQGRTSGYVELPYTLPQDSTLFLVLRESTPEIWLRKLDWIAQHGGMALVNIHPDYVNFGDRECSSLEYPSQRVKDLLTYVKERYSESYWNPCARDLAAWFAEASGHRTSLATRTIPATTSIESQDAHPSLWGKRAAVLLYSYYPADPRPRRAAEALAAAGMKVDLICLHEHTDEPVEEIIRGVCVTRLPWQKRRNSKLTYARQYASFVSACLAVLAKRSLSHRYDLVHVHNMPDVLVFGAAIPALLGAKIILDLHDPMPELMTSIYNVSDSHSLVRWLERAERASMAFADLVLTPNKAFRDLFVSRGCAPDKIQIVMNSPETSIFDSSLYEVPMRPEPQPFRLMYHGHLAERHGLDTALHALALLRPRLPELTFEIYGGRTEYMNRMESLIQSLHLTDAVTYHGHQSQAAIAAAIARIDLGVIPNRRNPFTEINMPTRIFEYVAMGKPVVVPDTRGIRDYMSRESVYFFEPGNAGSLAGAIERAFRNPGEAATMLNVASSIYREHTWAVQKEKFLGSVEGLLQTSGN